ncbi:MAG: PQQ-binding-like beta-propeller repeat protein, partial [Pirellulaceae bacterium]
MREGNTIRRWAQLNTMALASLLLLAGLARSEDWPMWRHDAGRSSATSEQLPAGLSLQWSRQLVEPRMAWPEDPRIHFDATVEPVYAGGLVFVPSSTTDSVTALDAVSGSVRWKFFADGPVRFAPVIAHGQVYFGADDGFIYCLAAATGKMQWRQAARPSNRQAIGSERVISVWPVRGGPVLAAGKIYFTAGVWPFEGVLLYDFAVAPNQQQPPVFRSRALNSLTPEGYAVASAGRLYLPCGRALAACFDLKTGQSVKLSYDSRGKTDYHVTAVGEFIFHGDRIYQVAEKRLLQTAVHRPVTGPEGVAGTLNNDLVGLNVKKPALVEVVDRKGKTQKVHVLPLSWRMKRADLAKIVGASSSDWKIHLQAGSRLYGHMGKQVFAIEPTGTDETAKVSWHVEIDSPARTMIAGDGRLIVVSESSKLYCFAAGDAQVRNHPLGKKPLAKAAPTGRWAELAKQIVTDNSDLQAYCLVPGIGSGKLIDQLLQRTELHLLVIDSSAEKVAALRRRCDAAGLYGQRLVARVGNVDTAQLPAYYANVIVSEVPMQGDVGVLYRSLRPYGGNAYLVNSDAAQISRIVEAGGLSKAKLK